MVSGVRKASRKILKPHVKLQRNGFDLIFWTGFTGLTGLFSPSARSPFGRRLFYPDAPVDPVQFSFKDEYTFLFFMQKLEFLICVLCVSAVNYYVICYLMLGILPI
jgi:hypothetical protein